MKGTNIFIVDKQSANGVIVDDQRIKSSIEIDESSKVKIGDYRLYLERASGKPQQAQLGGINTAIVLPEQAHAKIRIVAGPKAGREYLLFEPITCIGRTDENDITLADASVSRHHARIKRQDDGYVITDLNSSNGTAVRNKHIKPSSRLIFGQKIRFGHVECVFLDPQGKGGGAGVNRQWIFYGLAVLGAALLGALASLALRS